MGVEYKGHGQLDRRLHTACTEYIDGANANKTRLSRVPGRPPNQLARIRTIDESADATSVLYPSRL